MERSGSQKALLVFSIIEIIGAVIGLIGGILLMGGAGVLGSVEVADLTAKQQATGIAALGIVGVVIIISGIWSLLCGIFGIRAANDNQKIMIVWVFALIGVILAIVGIIAVFVNGSFGRNGLTMIFSGIFDIIIFWIANNIKKEAGK